MDSQLFLAGRRSRSRLSKREVSGLLSYTQVPPLLSMWFYTFQFRLPEKPDKLNSLLHRKVFYSFLPVYLKLCLPICHQYANRTKLTRFWNGLTLAMVCLVFGCLFETVSGVLDVTVSQGGLNPHVSCPLTCVVTKLIWCPAGSILR